MTEQELGRLTILLKRCQADGEIVVADASELQWRIYEIHDQHQETEDRVQHEFRQRDELFRRILETTR
jgi:hypothetical protein